jgi:hypothetical protein
LTLRDVKFALRCDNFATEHLEQEGREEREGYEFDLFPTFPIFASNLSPLAAEDESGFSSQSPA